MFFRLYVIIKLSSLCSTCKSDICAVIFRSRTKKRKKTDNEQAHKNRHVTQVQRVTCWLFSSTVQRDVTSLLRKSPTQTQVSPCWQRSDVRARRDANTDNLTWIPGKLKPLCCCWGWGVTCEIGTGRSWGRLPELLGARTEGPLLGAVCEKKEKKSAEPSRPSSLLPPNPSPLGFFFLSY